MSKNRYLYEDLRDVKEASNTLALAVLEELKKVLILILNIMRRDRSKK